ncbi:hypothetical protein Tco_1503928 [Tanacetum coccineum]
MDDPNITMEEYIRLEEEKVQKHKKVFNWETIKYGKIWCDEDIHDPRSIETKFPAIAFNDGVSSEKRLSCEPTVSSLNDEIDFRISFDDSDDEDYTVFDFGGLPDLMAEGLSARMLMEHMDAQGVDDTWAWVAMGPERQSDVVAGTPRVAQDAPVIDEGVQAVLRMDRLKEDIYEICRALAEQREVIGVMARDFLRFTIWAASGIAQLLDSARVTYTPYSETRIPYQRSVRRSTGEASTSTAQQDP